MVMTEKNPTQKDICNDDENISKKVTPPKLNNVYAVIFSSNNKNPEIVNINNYVDFFHHNNSTYFISYDDVMTMKVKRWLVRHDFYIFYFYDNPNPIRISENLSVKNLSIKVLPSKTVNTIIKTEALKKVESSSNKFNLENIKPEYVIGIMIVIGVIIYLLMGGNITP